MAINPETQYPGKIAPSTPDYPYGAARNITTPGDGTFGGFSSMAYDRVANEVVVYEDGDLYVIPGP